jgi:hypothetical protein
MRSEGGGWRCSVLPTVISLAAVVFPRQFAALETEAWEAWGVFVGIA